MSWTQPICDLCWDAAYTTDGEDDYEPIRVGYAREEICCLCGLVTTSGTYIRRDPATVPYPTGT